MKSPDQHRGAALIAVLSLLGLLTVLALGALNATRRHARLAQTSFLLVQQRELADSALRLSILELAAPERAAATPTLGQRHLTLFGQAVTVDVQLESGRIDLNYASESSLVAGFVGNDIDENQARKLAARIMDWRDADDMTSTQGAEQSDYRRANRNGPRNGPFESVSELRLVLDAGDLPERVLDAFTVYSHLPDVKVDGQPRTLDGEVVRLRACTSPQPLDTCRTAVVRFTGDRSNPVLIFEWR